MTTYKKKFKLIFLISIVILTSLHYGKLIAQNEQLSETDQKILMQAQKFKFILETAQKNALDSFDIEKVSEVAFNAMLKDLDPFSTYFPPEKQKNIDERSKGSQESVGLDLASIADTLVLISIAHSSPADSAGIKTGDKLLFINGENSVRFSREEALRKLVGDKGSKVSLIIRRGTGNVLQEFVLSRRDVSIPSVDASFMIAGTKTAYLKCNRISETTYKDIIESLTELKKKGMKSLILDVRGNTGGQLDETCKIVDLFLEGNQKITYTQARNQNFIYEFKSKKGDPFEKLPVIVIIDANSSSGSEVIAGSFQDNDRGIIIGEQSFGKGLAQSQWKMGDGSGFRLTVASYRTPSGRNIQKPYKNSELPILDPSAALSTNAEVILQMEELIRKTGGQKSLPLYQTLKGRTVIGGGGIFPDYYEKKDTITLLTKVLQSKGIFAETTINFLSKNRELLEKRYGENYIKFSSEFVVDSSLLFELKRVAYSKNTWNDQMYSQDLTYISHFLKANISYFLWGNNGLESVMIDIDKPIKKAILVIPEAEKMIN
ncbi:MAG: S41 family peptidase [Candidatus Kapabacteria bacterium]|nr:S41 family peptidase [Candidatus Kapabacteria bacterium]